MSRTFIDVWKEAEGEPDADVEAAWAIEIEKARG